MYVFSVLAMSLLARMIKIMSDYISIKIWGKAQRESTQHPKSNKGKIQRG